MYHTMYPQMYQTADSNRAILKSEQQQTACAVQTEHTKASRDCQQPDGELDRLKL
jgi:hypothetical protein